MSIHDRNIPVELSFLDLGNLLTAVQLCLRATGMQELVELNKYLKRQSRKHSTPELANELLTHSFSALNETLEKLDKDNG